MALAEVAVTLAGKEAFKKTVSGVFDFVTRATGRKIRQWNTERKIEGLYRNIAKVRRVKTIWQVDKAVDLTAFYCDSHVIVNGGRNKVHQVSDLPTGNVLIEGIAGQGKSILLRYLCSVELAIARCIPVFVELRRVTQTHTLRDRIYTAFNALGLSVDDELFDALAASGKILLLLDAFDEVPDDHKQRVLTDIEDIASTKDALRIIVTSRPNNTIKMSNQFTVLTLDNLKNDEYKHFVQKLAAGQTWSNTLVRHVETQASHIKELLCTPLMVTLLVLCYKSYQKLPTKLSDFYDALFQTLLQRHDGTKPGFTRERRCALDDSQYRQVFESICINAKKARQQSFNHEAIYGVTQSAVTQCALDVNPQSYLDDIVKITCLILRDGEEYRFIHKTVQEYYTAAYIWKKPESWASDFYSRLSDGIKHDEWRQELAFLSEIDTHRYNKHFFLPAILGFLRITEENLQRKLRKPSLARIRELMTPIVVEFSESDSEDTRFLIQGSIHFLSFSVLGELLTEIRTSSLKSAIASGMLAEKDPPRMQETDHRLLVASHGYSRVRADKLLDNVIPRDTYRVIVEDEFQRLFETAKHLRESLDGAESEDLLEGLL